MVLAACTLDSDLKSECWFPVSAVKIGLYWKSEDKSANPVFPLSNFVALAKSCLFLGAVFSGVKGSEWRWIGLIPGCVWDHLGETWEPCWWPGLLTYEVRTCDGVFIKRGSGDSVRMSELSTPGHLISSVLLDLWSPSPMSWAVISHKARFERAVCRLVDHKPAACGGWGVSMGEVWGDSEWNWISLNIKPGLGQVHHFFFVGPRRWEDRWAGAGKIAFVPWRKACREIRQAYYFSSGAGAV